MKETLENWLRQTSTIHAIGVLAMVVGGALTQVTFGNPTWDAVIGVLAYLLVHLGIDDHSAKQAAMSKMAEDAVSSIKNQNVPADKLMSDLLEVLKASSQTAPAPVPVVAIGDVPTKTNP